MIIDGIDLSTINVIVEDRTPSRSAAATAQIVEGAPGAWRRIRLGRNVPEALQIHVIGHVVNEALDLEALRASIDQFKYMLRPNKELAVRWSDMTGDTPVREWLGYRHILRVDDIKPGWLTEAVRFDLTLICPDPFANEASLQNKNTSGSAPLVLTSDVGTAPMPVIITLQGHATNLVNPVLHYRDGSDADIIVISYAGTLTVSDTLVIDTEFFTAEVNSANVGGLISGSYFDVDPGDGDKYGGSPTYPDIQLTADSGDATLFKVEYKRRYW